MKEQIYNPDDSYYANPEQLEFKDFIREKLKAVNSVSGYRHITAEELAETFGMSKKVFLEILNGRRGDSDRRDFVIALCAELGLDTVETNEALRLFPGFLRKLSADDPRDRLIMDFLDAGFDVDISYASLNQHLIAHNYPPLRIKYRNPAQNGKRRDRMEEKKIDWNLRTAEERQRYNYYISLGYDNKAASVLALFTYGKESISGFSVPDAYEAFASGRSYPVKIPDPIFSGGELLQRRGRIQYNTVRCKEELSYTSASYAAPYMTPPSIPKQGSAASAGNYPDTDEYEGIEEKNARSTSQQSNSTFRMTANTASVGILLNQLRNRRSITKDMVRIEEMLNYFRYEVPKPKKDLFRISTELKDQENGKKLLYIHVQAKEAVKENQNIVVLLDVSGSMSSEKVHTQAAVATIVSKLKAGDTFSLVTYSDEDRVVLEGVTISSEGDKIRVLEKFLGISIERCTYGSAGIKKAYEIGKRYYKSNGNNQVILITDGDLNFGITSQGGLEKLIEEKKKSNLFLSVIGTGLTNYKDNKLETLSKHGNGIYCVINNISDVKKSIRDAYASLVNIVAKDVKAQVEFNPEIVKTYRLLGFENREISREDFANDTVISEPFGSGGYGIALYDLEMRAEPETVSGVSRYSTMQTTGSSELGVVHIRYKEPLEEVSHEIECVIPSADEHYSDNLVLAQIIYVCAEKLRDSEKIDAQEEALALAAIDTLGTGIKLLNYDDIGKLREILKRSKEQLHVSSPSEDEFIW